MHHKKKEENNLNSNCTIFFSTKMNYFNRKIFKIFSKKTQNNINLYIKINIYFGVLHLLRRNILLLEFYK